MTSVWTVEEDQCVMEKNVEFCYSAAIISETVYKLHVR